MERFVQLVPIFSPIPNTRTSTCPSFSDLEHCSNLFSERVEIRNLIQKSRKMSIPPTWLSSSHEVATRIFISWKIKVIMVLHELCLPNFYKICWERLWLDWGIISLNESSHNLSQRVFILCNKLVIIEAALRQCD